jgi:hypothetical protein
MARQLRKENLMPYYLTHPEHGTHICYTPEDVEAHKRIGWVPMEENKQLFAGSKFSDEQVNAANGAEPLVFNVVDISKQPKKRGRKPKDKA